MAAPQIGVLLPLRLETRFTRSRTPAALAPARARRARRGLDREPRRRAQPRSSSTRSRRCGGPPAAPTSSRAEGRRAWRALAAVGRRRARGVARAHVPAGRRLGRHDHDHPADADAHRHARPPRARPAADPRDLDRTRRGRPGPGRHADRASRRDVDLDLDDPEQHQAAVVDVVHRGRARRARRRNRPRHRNADRHRRDLRRRHRRRRPRPAARGAGRQWPPRHRLAGVGDEHASTARRPSRSATSTHGAASSPSAPNAQAGTVAVSKAVAGAPRLRGVIGGADDHRPLNRAVMGVLWPAMWGHSLANVWGFSTPGGRARPLGRRESRARGPAALAADRGAAVRAAAGHLAATAGRRPAATRRSRRGSCRSCAASSPPGRPRRSGRPREQQGDVLRGLVRNPTAARYAWQWMVPTTLAHALAFRFNQSVPGGRPQRLVDAAGRADAAARPGRLARPAARRRRAGRHDVDAPTSSSRRTSGPNADPPRRGNRRRTARRRRGGGAPADAAGVGNEPSHRAGAALAARKLGGGRAPHGRRGARGRRAPRESTAARPRRPRRGRFACALPISPGAATRPSASARTSSTD